MALITNPWVGYLDRTYVQIKNAVLPKLGVKVSEITDHSANDPLVDALDIWSGIAEVLHIYIDNKGREVFIGTARKFASAVKIARLFDYRVRGAVAASADIKFEINAAIGTNITIPQGTEVKTSNGYRFFTTTVATITAGQTEVTVAAENKFQATGVSLGNSNGNPRQSIVIPETKAIVDGSVEVTVVATTWTPVDTFGFSLQPDEHFVAGLNETGAMAVVFGDDVTGKIPTTGSALSCAYETCDGALANVGRKTITQIVSPITVPPGTILTATNDVRASGGVDSEGLEALRRRIPLHIRTLQRAVTEQDYIDVAELANGVIRAGVIYECGKTIDVYIAPDGGGIASGALIASTQTYLDDRKMITTFPVVHAAGEVRVKLQANVRAKPNYTNAGVLAAIITNLTTFISVAKQKIGGRVFLSDIYQQIEGTEGVDNSDVLVMTTVPYARPLSVGIPVLDWTRLITPESTGTIQWKITFVNISTFQLYKAGSFIGNFPVDVQTDQGEILFTVNSGPAYAINHQYEFYTYPYFGNIDLQEPSVPVSLASDLNINVGGGI